jgi:hypothetical protein
MLETFAKVAVFAVFGIVFAFIGIVLWQSLFESAQQNYYSASAQEQNPEQQNINEHPSETSPIINIKKSADDRLATYTLYLAIFTALLVLVSAFQISFLIRTDKIAAVTAQAARDSADAAKKAADAAMAGQRAIVVPTPYWEKDAGTFNFGVTWTNAGNTTASQMRNHIGHVIIKGELPTNFEFPDNAAPLAKGTMLGPKQYTMGPHIPAEGSISADELAAIHRGEKNLFFFGWVKYFDGFPNTPERITKFCYAVRVINNPKIPFVFIPSDRNNCADEGCDQNK